MREIDFSRLYVTDENYSGKHGQRDVEFLKKIISDKELVYIQFTHCTFVGMDLRDMDLKDLWFQDCMFQDCRFQKSRIEEWYAERTRFRKCSFKDASRRWKKSVRNQERRPSSWKDRWKRRKENK